LVQIQPSFVSRAEFIAGNGSPIGFGCQVHNAIQEASPWHVLLAELGGEVFGLAECAKLGKHQVKVFIGEIQVRLVMADGLDVQDMAVRNGKALLFAGGPHPAPLAEIQAILRRCHALICAGQVRPGRR